MTDDNDLSQPVTDPETDPEQNTEAAETEEAPPAEDGSRKELPKWVKDRIAKTKSQRDSARQEAEALKARIAELEAKANQPAPEPPAAPKPPATAGPLADITDPKALEQKRTEARQTVQTVEDLMDQLMDEPESVEQQLREAGVIKGAEPWTPKQMREYLRGIRRHATETLEAVPQREQFLRHEAAAYAEAVKTTPELQSKETPLAKTWLAVANDPGFRALRASDPNWPLHARRYALGVLAEQQQGQTKAPTASPARTVNAPKVPRPIAEAPRAQATGTEPGDAQEAQIRQRAASPNATAEDRRALIALDLRKSRESARNG